MKVLVNQEMGPVGVFSVIVKTDGSFEALLLILFQMMILLMLTTSLLVRRVQPVLQQVGLLHLDPAVRERGAAAVQGRCGGRHPRWVLIMMMMMMMMMLVLQASAEMTATARPGPPPAVPWATAGEECR